MENNPVPCKLKIPKDLNSKTPAFLVNFSNGNIDPNSSDRLHFKNLLLREDRSKSKRVLMASNGRLNYQSEAVDNNNGSASRMCYYVGVRSKSTGRMKVYDAALFHLKPVMKTDSTSSATGEDKNVRERLDDLTESFGSKSKKRALKSRQKYSTVGAPMDDSNLEDLSLDESFDNANQSVSIPSASNTSIDYIPPQNREARSPDEVYRIGDIIPSEDDTCLDAMAEELLQELPAQFSKWKMEGTYCEYVLRHLNSTIDYVKVKYLIYYDFLLKFSQLKAPDMKKKYPVPEFPEPIRSTLLEFFTVTSQNDFGRPVRSFTATMKDKLLAHMLVLALLIDDYCVNLADVQSGTRFGMPKVVKVAQVLGCRTVSRKVNDSSIQFAELRLPLAVQQKYYKKF